MSDRALLEEFLLYTYNMLANSGDKLLKKLFKSNTEDDKNVEKTINFR